VAQTLQFTTVGPLPTASELEAWLTEQGEPFVSEQLHVITLRALPLTLSFTQEGLRGEVCLHEDVPLTRLVRLLFDLALRVGGELRLTEVGVVDRAGLWVRLADEQDRHRIVAALRRADQHGQREDVLTSLWSLLCTLGHGQDLRWDPVLESIVAVRDVLRTRELDGLGDVTEDDPTPVGSIAVPVQSEMHMLAWRWLSEAHPSLRVR
jgi:hypothetical protein